LIPPGLFYLLGFILVFAPLIRGGNRPLPLLVLEMAGVVGLAMLAWSRSGARARLPATLWWGLALLVAVPALQLVPLPASWWAALPGHQAYVRALDLAGPAASGEWRALTVHAGATEYAWLALIPAIAVFFMVQGLDRVQVRRLAAIFLAVAACEAVLGIVQVGAPRGSLVTLGNPYGGGSASGTYVNRNHFAALMAMALPLVLAVWALQMVPIVDQHGEVMREHPRFADAKLAVRILFSILVAVLLLALLMTRSRAGIGSGLFVFALASLGFVGNAGSREARIALGVVAAGALLLAAYVGLTPVLERFAPDELSMHYEGRVQLALATVRAALDFLPFGSGLGTFADVFRRYQVDRLTGFIDHAHNDYAEAFLELGVAGLAALALLGAAYLARWRELARGRLSRRLGMLQYAAGLGMLAMIVHGAFDFNFHIPANAVYFAFLAGIFFFTPAEDLA
jgi:O-antigen ligase